MPIIRLSTTPSSGHVLRVSLRSVSLDGRYNFSVLCDIFCHKGRADIYVVCLRRTIQMIDQTAYTPVCRAFAPYCELSLNYWHKY